MAKCPACSRDVATPFLLNVDAWRWLACPHCGARLERKNPRYALPAVAFFLVAVSVGRLLGHRYIVLSYALLALTVAAALAALLLPSGLQLRKAPPEPQTRLNLEK
jgi:DNA-directed RNA polymerase subunit RPC12/RpoP